jgi:hypothetical protein
MFVLIHLYVYLFNAIGSAGCIASTERMRNGLERMWKVAEVT